MKSWMNEIHVAPGGGSRKKHNSSENGRSHTGVCPGLVASFRMEEDGLCWVGIVEKIYELCDRSTHARSASIAVGVVSRRPAIEVVQYDDNRSAPTGAALNGSVSSWTQSGCSAAASARASSSFSAWTAPAPCTSRKGTGCNQKTASGRRVISRATHAASLRIGF